MTFGNKSFLRSLEQQPQGFFKDFQNPVEGNKIQAVPISLSR